jgi:hypothetical protein
MGKNESKPSGSKVKCQGNKNQGFTRLSITNKTIDSLNVYIMPSPERGTESVNCLISDT